MAQNKNVSATFFTAPFILSYPKLTKAEPYMENGKPKGDPHFSLEGISEIDSLADWREVNRDEGTFDPVKIEVRLVQMVKEQFGADFDVKKAVADKALSWPFKSGDKKADEKGEKGAHYRGKKFWRAKAKEEINGQRNDVNLYVNTGGGVDRVVLGTTEGGRLAANKFYGGAVCTAELNAVVGETAQGRYATFYVNAVIFQEDGDRLGGESNVARMYGVKGGKTQEDPTKGMSGGKELDDEIPY